MKPSMCNNTEVTLPEVDCDCEGLSNRITALEDFSDDADDRIGTLENCCGDVNDTLVSHGQSINLINHDIEDLNDRVDNLSGLTVVKVNSLPATGASNTIYLVPNGDSSDMWMYIEGNWEKVGDTAVDLSDYATISQLNQKAPNPKVNSVVITATTASPNYDGTWVRVDKSFTNTSIADDGVNWDSTNTSNGNSLVIRKDKSVQIRLHWLSKIFMDDDTPKRICTIPYSTLGITAINDIHVLGYSDGDNCIGMFSVLSDPNNSLVTVEKQDAIHKGGEYKGNAWEVIIDLMFSASVMRDNACDKFYWKRTA